MTVLAAIVSVDPWPDHTEPGRATAFMVLAAFLVTFVFIRTSARLIRISSRPSDWPSPARRGRAGDTRVRAPGA